MLDIFLNIFYATAGVLALYYGADFLVKGGASIARKAGISPLVIGLTLVAFATSAPELVVSVSAALDGSADISLGNVVGSNICNIALILGLCALITPMPVQSQLQKFDGPVMILCTFAMCGCYWYFDGISRWTGIIFVVGLLAYMYFCVKIAKREEKLTAESGGTCPEQAEKTDDEPPCPVWKALILTVAGLALLVGGAKVFVLSALFFAKQMAISEAVVGLTIVAVGTSLPELATSVVAAVKNEQDIAIGNVLGSNIFNILCVLGLSTAISPMGITKISMVDMGVVLGVSILLIIMMWTGRRLSRWEGGILLLGYIGYTAWLVMHAQA